MTKLSNKQNSSSRSKKKLGVSSFFAGIGGFDLGFENAGFETVFHCEINDFCNSVLDRHWPEIQRATDINNIEAESIPESDIWCGGFPCQDVSVARGWLGRDGLKGKNSGLFFPFISLVEERPPEVVLLENVAGLLSSHNGKDFSAILSSFQNLGYGVAWRTLNTRYFGAPQSRPRVYICAWRNSTKKAVNALFENGTPAELENQRAGFLRETICDFTGAIVPEIAFCLAATSGRHTGTDWSRSYISYRDQVRRLTPTECERLQGFPQDWTLPGSDFKPPRQDLDSLRYHAIGNAVSVPVVQWIAKRIKREMSPLRPTSALASRSSWRELQYAVDRVHEFSLSQSATINISAGIEHDECPKIKWRNSGVVSDYKCITAPVSPSPKKPIDSYLVDILDKESPSERYYLSPNAAKGIIRRVENQGRALFEPLDKALRQLAKSERRNELSVAINT